MAEDTDGALHAARVPTSPRMSKCIHGKQHWDLLPENVLSVEKAGHWERLKAGREGDDTG